MPEDLSDLGRFTYPALLILCSLKEEPKRGHALIEDIERFSGVCMQPGTLYGAIARLERRGLIERRDLLNQGEVRSSREELSMPKDVSDLGRFTDPSLLILSSLASGPKHGYAMMEDIEQFSGTHLEPGTLYGAIARLERRGLIEPLESEERRRPYRITGAGVALLREQLATMQKVVTTGFQRLPAF
jgi:DNA-binding PadR family transcriptional regulator